jgi:hypothetical protein
MPLCIRAWLPPPGISSVELALKPVAASQREPRVQIEAFDGQQSLHRSLQLQPEAVPRVHREALLREDS